MKLKVLSKIVIDYFSSFLDYYKFIIMFIKHVLVVLSVESRILRVDIVFVDTFKTALTPYLNSQISNCS